MGEPGPPQAAAQVVIDIGYASSKVLIQRNGQVMFFKLIELGGRHFDQAVAEHLKLPVSEAAKLRMGLNNRGPGDAPNLTEARRELVERAVYESVRSVTADLAREVGLCLRYYSVSFRGRRPETAILTGGEAATPHAAEVLSEGAGIRAVSLQEAAADSGAPGITSFSDRPAVTQSAHRWATTLGLALRVKSGVAMRGAA